MINLAFTRRCLAALCVVALFGGTAPAAVSTSSPEAFIRSLGDEVIQILVDKSLDQGRREAKFQDMLVEYVDTDTVSRTVLGRYWNAATDEQRRDFQGLYREYLIRIYAARFSKFNGEKFNVKSARNESDRDSLVISSIEPPSGSGPTYAVNWRVRRTEAGGYRVVDVMAEGVSLLVTHNQEFSSVIQNNGGKVQGLLDALRQRIAAAKGR